MAPGSGTKIWREDKTIYLFLFFIFLVWLDEKCIYLLNTSNNEGFSMMDRQIIDQNEICVPCFLGSSFPRLPAMVGCSHLPWLGLPPEQSLPAFCLKKSLLCPGRHTCLFPFLGWSAAELTHVSGGGVLTVSESWNNRNPSWSSPARCTSKVYGRALSGNINPQEAASAGRTEGSLPSTLGVSSRL